MTSIADILHKTILLTTNVDSLKNDIKRINDHLLNLNDRVVRLEMSSDLNAEKAKNAALIAVQATTNEMLREVYELKLRLEKLPKIGTTAPPEILIKGHNDQNFPATTSKNDE